MLDPKPSRRIKATSEGWDDLRVAKLYGRLCRVCGQESGRYAESLHHLVPRSLGGDDVADNLIPACGDGTRGCHGRLENRDSVACERLRARLSEWEIAYVTQRKGQAFLDHYYPRGE